MSLQLPENKALSRGIVALHKKSGQKSDAVVNGDFLASFCQFFETKKSYFAHKKRSWAILFVQSRVLSGNQHLYLLKSRYGKVSFIREGLRSYVWQG